VTSYYTKCTIVFFHTSSLVADLCQSTICVLFVLPRRKTTKRQDDKTMTIVFFASKKTTRQQNRQDDKTKSRQDDRIKGKDDKHNLLISNLICRLFFWRFVVLLSFSIEKTTHKDDKTKSRQIKLFITILLCFICHLEFCRLVDFLLCGLFCECKKQCKNGTIVII
jgi:hypothetical protein